MGCTPSTKDKRITEDKTQAINNNLAYQSYQKNQNKQEEYFDDVLIEHPSILCECQSPMDFICIQNCGQSSLHCSNKLCNLNQTKHLNCKVIYFDGLTNILQEKLKDYKQFLTEIYRIEDSIVAQLRQKRKMSIKNLLFRTFEDSQRALMEEIYVKKNKFFKKGFELNEVYKILQQKKIDKSEYIKQFHIQANKTNKNLCNFKEVIIQNYLKSNRLFYIDSLILSKYEGRDYQEMKFINKCLNYPQKIKPIFRASQHQFSAVKFHRICDGIPNLLVLAKTEFGKVIGGFNSIGWKSQLHERYSADNENKCFIYSVTLRQKMDLVQPKKAIYNRIQSGPLFGHFCDISLSDKCNQNNNSGSSFPSCYNYKQKPYTKSEQTNKLFSGSSTGNFGVVEYEVFSVVQ